MGSEAVTIREYRKRYRSLFYRNQTWFDGESFIDRETTFQTFTAPKNVLPYSTPPDLDAVDLPYAVDLIACYVMHPTSPVWLSYLWTADVDRHGQRIYIGVNDGRMEIHRHIRITERFGVAAWA